MAAVEGDVQLNLARKWRSKQFEQIIGQNLSVRILKNSLFRGKFFPVYLFAGQHGCGKTTTARVFAAAVNCEQLLDFQQNPKKFVVPCLQCASCKAILAGKHPDFIEIDAASHTGVDNVRQIVEASTLLPVMGRKKIYLIDEAHMLSKAAFNAFLKILEEPPEGVFFILATTDEHKIIDTVKSRCFQLFFNAVNSDTLRDHLANVCKQESIIFDDDGLLAIIKETGGSVRDALNLLEQICFSAQRVTREDVLRALGYMPEETLYALIEKVFFAISSQELIAFIDGLNLGQYNATHFWRRLLESIHQSIWLKNGVTPKGREVMPGDFVARIDVLPLPLLLNLFEMMCEEEQLFLKTVHKGLFLQLLLVRMWQQIHEQVPVTFSQKKQDYPEQDYPEQAHTEQAYPEQESFSVPVKEDAKKKSSTENKETVVKKEEVIEKKVTQPVVLQPVVLQPVVPQPVAVTSWDQFVQAVDALEEPLFSSIVKQAVFDGIKENIVSVQFAHRMVLFKDTVEQLKPKWQPLLKKFFGDGAVLNAQFTAVTSAVAVKKKAKEQAGPGQAGPGRMEARAMVRPETFRHGGMRIMPMRGKKVDVSDKNLWPLSNTLLSYFPGVVVEVPEQKNESNK